MGNNNNSNKSSASGSIKKPDPTKLTEEEINLLLANTSYKKEEILQWHAGFIVSFNFIPLIEVLLTHGNISIVASLHIEI